MDLTFGMPAGFSDLLAQKYALMRQNADATTVSTNAAANLDNVRAQVLPGATAADIAKTNAETQGITTTNKFIAPLSLANLGLVGAQTQNFLATAGDTRQAAIAKAQLNKSLGFGLGAGGPQDNKLGFGGYGFQYSN